MVGSGLLVVVSAAQGGGEDDEWTVAGWVVVVVVASPVEAVKETDGCSTERVKCELPSRSSISDTLLPRHVRGCLVGRGGGGLDSYCSKHW